MHVPPGRNVVFCLSALRRQAASNEPSSLPVEELVQEQEAQQQGDGAIATTDETLIEEDIEPPSAETQENEFK